MKDSYLGNAGDAARAFSNLQIYFCATPIGSACAGAWYNSRSPLKLDDRNTGCSELQPVKFTHSRKQDELAWGDLFNQEKSNDRKPRF